MHRSCFDRNTKPKAFLVSIACVGSLALAQAPAAEQVTYTYGPAKKILPKEIP